MMFHVSHFMLQFACLMACCFVSCFTACLTRHILSFMSYRVEASTIAGIVELCFQERSMKADHCVVLYCSALYRIVLCRTSTLPRWNGWTWTLPTSSIHVHTTWVWKGRVSTLPASCMQARMADLENGERHDYVRCHTSLSPCRATQVLRASLNLGSSNIYWLEGFLSLLFIHSPSLLPFTFAFLVQWDTCHL